MFKFHDKANAFVLMSKSVNTLIMILLGQKMIIYYNTQDYLSQSLSLSANQIIYNVVIIIQLEKVKYCLFLYELLDQV